jgi:hypothetical protein
MSLTFTNSAHLEPTNWISLKGMKDLMVTSHYKEDFVYQKNIRVGDFISAFTLVNY